LRIFLRAASSAFSPQFITRSMTKGEFAKRAFDFAVRCARLAQSLPRGNVAAQEYGRQLLRCSSSVAANYRAACRGRSPGDFLAKLGIVEEEADESIFWMDLIVAIGLSTTDRLSALRQEGNEILAMIVASINTARKSTRRTAIPEKAA
jgi:four helix bundle protein